MDENTEIYFLDDDDVRNRSVTVDHRPRTGRVSGAVIRPQSMQSAQPRRVVVSRPVPPAPVKEGIFAKVTPGQLAELATMVIAALMPLPAAPLAQGAPMTDMNNQLAYTGALALHAKRDEQLRTIGALFGKLVG